MGSRVRDVSYSTVRDYIARRRPQILVEAGRSLEQPSSRRLIRPGRRPRSTSQTCGSICAESGPRCSCSRCGCRRRARRCTALLPAQFLFTPHGRRLGQQAVRAELSRAAQHAGLDHIKPHQLRHTYATALVNAGVSLQALMALLGHASAEMSLRYGRLFDTTRRVRARAGPGQAASPHPTRRFNQPAADRVLRS